MTLALRVRGLEMEIAMPAETTLTRTPPSAEAVEGTSVYELQLSPYLTTRLVSRGIRTIEEILAPGGEDRLLEVKRIGPHTAKRIIHACRLYVGIPLTKEELGPHIVRRLSRNGIKTSRQLMERGRNEILRMRSLSAEDLLRIDEWLIRLGLGPRFYPISAIISPYGGPIRPLKRPRPDDS